ncbi:hypothetical protein NUW54_g12086 [Trametes sanguinea]|uniref:Uncharacterized protein n=1 Tax=Trametes sanguinea TaxID=158606 RepID=A0ACC1N338_9APHY|nr:hypothetical protein NUW54_g12086 [Trametes sanguinea]
MRIELGRRGLLQGDIISYALRKVGLAPPHDEQQQNEEAHVHEQEIADVDGPRIESHVYLSKQYAQRGSVRAVAEALDTPGLRDLLRRFLRDQLYPDFDEPGEVVPLADCPWVPLSTRVAVHHSATAIFYAPSELCGPGGMHSEIIRSTPSWRDEGARHDTVLVQLSGDPGMQGMGVARVRTFLSFSYGITRYECTLVSWFELVGDGPDPLTGMWIVRPELDHGQEVLSIISTEAIVRSCHLIGVFGNTRLPVDFHFSQTLDAFRRYYVNPYADYHMHELLK